MAYPDPLPLPRSRQRFEYVAAAVGETGALVLATTSAVDVVVDVADRLAGFGFVAWNSLELAAFCALLLGFAGLVTSRAAGSGVLARCGVGVAFLGLGTFVAVGVVTYTDGEVASRLNLVAIAVTSVGMVLTGVAVLRDRSWRGWQRYMPLVCGLYGGVVELPGALVLRPSPVFDVVVVGNWLTWVALNLGLWLVASTPARAPARR